MTDALGLYVHLVSARVRSDMQYKVSFALNVAGSFIGSGLDFAGILVFFSRFPAIGGWSMPEIALLYGLVGVPFALAHLVGEGLDEFADQIREGRFDQVLLRPRGAFLQVLGSRLALRQLGRLTQASLVMALALRWLALDWGPAQWLFAAWTILGGFAFFMGLMTLRAVASFWTIESLEAINILTYGGSEMASYPMHIFAGWLRRTFTFLLPLAFVSYYPALYLLGRPDPTGLPGWSASAAFPLCALVLGLALVGWSVGVRHYQSTGH